MIAKAGLTGGRAHGRRGSRDEKGAGAVPGGTVTDWAGAPLGRHSNGTILAAATPALHAAALAVLAT